jgi:hypothetical protein
MVKTISWEKNMKKVFKNNKSAKGKNMECAILML